MARLIELGTGIMHGGVLRYFIVVGRAMIEYFP
jgi:hypothetical protein